ncbi:right-handed parallel beta-helix repeat-containing protein, partial [Paracoccus sp. 1_MG-2023]
MTLPSLVLPTQPAVRPDQTAFSNPFELAGQPSTSSYDLQDFYSAEGLDPEWPVVQVSDDEDDQGDDQEPDVDPDPLPVEQIPPVEPVEPVEPTDPVEPVETLDPATQETSAMAGRVTILTPDSQDDIASMRILSAPEHGSVSVNPDNSLALVLTENPEMDDDLSFQYEVTYLDGRSQVIDATIDVTKGAEAEGWGMGDFYMLEQTASGDLVVEHGDNHRKVHITEGDHGLSRADIAKAEGLGEDKITSSWLVEHPEYGASADMALQSDLGMELWYAITGRGVEPSSDWLLMERGYEYEGLGRIVSRGAEGESALHPMYVGAYGEGADPIVTDEVLLFQDRSANIVIQNIEARGGFSMNGADNLLLDNLTITGGEAVLKNIDGLTFQNSQVLDVAREETVREGEVWHASNNRISGAYLSGVEGGLLRDNLFDRNGWAEGYDYDMSTDAPMPPSYYNHNLYVQTTNLDITVRDNVFMRAASFGVQLRPGGVLEGNSFIDNNAAVN